MPFTYHAVQLQEICHCINNSIELVTQETYKFSKFLLPSSFKLSTDVIIRIEFSWDGTYRAI